MSIQRGRLTTQATASNPADLATWVLSGGWTAVGPGTGTYPLTLLEAAQTLTYGARVGPRTMANNRFTTDYVELMIRYIVTN
jgi:hypothetical protein